MRVRLNSLFATKEEAEWQVKINKNKKYKIKTVIILLILLQPFLMCNYKQYIE